MSLTTFELLADPGQFSGIMEEVELFSWNRFYIEGLLEVVLVCLLDIRELFFFFSKFDPIVLQVIHKLFLVGLFQSGCGINPTMDIQVQESFMG